MKKQEEIRRWESLVNVLRQAPEKSAPPGLADAVLHRIRAAEVEDTPARSWPMGFKPALALGVLVLAFCVLWLASPTKETDQALAFGRHFPITPHPVPEWKAAPPRWDSANSEKIAALITKAEKHGLPDSVVKTALREALAKHQTPEKTFVDLELELERRMYALHRPAQAPASGPEPAPELLGKSLDRMETEAGKAEKNVQKQEQKLEKMELKKDKVEEKMEKSMKRKGLD